MSDPTDSTVANATIVHRQFNITINHTKSTEVLEQARQKIAKDKLLAEQIRERTVQTETNVSGSTTVITNILWWLLFGMGLPFFTNYSELRTAGATHKSILTKGRVQAEGDAALLQDAVDDNINTAAVIQECLEKISREEETLNGYLEGVREHRAALDSQDEWGGEEEAKLEESKGGHPVEEPQRSRNHSNEKDARRVKELEEELQAMQLWMNQRITLQAELELAQVEVELANRKLESELSKAREKQEKMQEQLRQAEEIRKQKASRSCLQQLWDLLTGQ